MNAVEIEAAVSDLAARPFDASEFPFQFLAAFDKKETTLKRLRKGESNKSDVPGAVLLVNNIHLATCPAGQTRQMLEALKASVRTASARAKFVFATDGSFFEAEDLSAGQEPVADELRNLANHFGFFLPLAGISSVREIKDNPIDVRATGRLNKLYVELLRLNPEWGTEGRRHDMNHFMARLIFCFFAEDTDIFVSRRLFTATVEQMSEPDGSNTHRVIEAVFRGMNVKIADRAFSDLPNYTAQFPYVNGGLFSGSTEVPHFSRIARSYLIQAGNLDWQHINPDIFGSMIQAVADEEERGALGMHYTSVPNILKVLNPLFLDDLWAQLEAAGENSRMLLNLRRRMSRIRVFDPACGSGNFLVIAYKEMRKIEAEINRRRNEPLLATEISKKNFRGIEIRDFAAEIARLALVIAEYQCDVLHRGPLAAKAEFLPLDEMNWITCGNALRLDWVQVCPPEGKSVKLHSNDLFRTPLEQPEIDFENEGGGETYICGNPPYAGSVLQDADQKADLKAVYPCEDNGWKSLDYVAGWFIKAADYAPRTYCRFAFVSTNSICQGELVPILWPLLLAACLEIGFAYSSFRWTNLAAHKAGVTVVIVGLRSDCGIDRDFYEVDREGQVTLRRVRNISPYLVPGSNVIVRASSSPLISRGQMLRGNMPNDGGHLILERDEAILICESDASILRYLRRFVGSRDFINHGMRYCIWIDEKDLDDALTHPAIAERVQKVKVTRTAGGKQARDNAESPHRFVFAPHRDVPTIIVPRHFSERREYVTAGLLDGRHHVVADSAQVIYGAELCDVAILVSRIHLVWIATVCGKLKTDFRYSNTLGWNTFPIPTLTDQNKADLARAAEDILLAREAHFPATIADLYDPETMPDDLRAAHEANDEVLERIYIGRRFRNDTERLEKLFEMYTRMPMQTTAGPVVKSGRRANA